MVCAGLHTVMPFTCEVVPPLSAQAPDAFGSAHAIDTGNNPEPTIETASTAAVTSMPTRFGPLNKERQALTGLAFTSTSKKFENR